MLCAEGIWLKWDTTCRMVSCQSRGVLSDIPSALRCRSQRQTQVQLDSSHVRSRFWAGRSGASPAEPLCQSQLAVRSVAVVIIVIVIVIVVAQICLLP